MFVAFINLLYFSLELSRLHVLAVKDIQADHHYYCNTHDELPVPVTCDIPHCIFIRVSASCKEAIGRQQGRKTLPWGKT